MRPCILLALLAVACADDAPPPPAAGGPVARSVRAAADEAGVPADLLLAIGVKEGGVKLARWRVVRDDDHVPVAGVLELRRGRLDTLALGARLVGATIDQLRADTDLGTRAGALVLAQLGAETGAKIDDLSTWRAAVERLSGQSDARARAYADGVFALLRAGGSFPARDGERVQLAAHPALPYADIDDDGIGHQQFAVETPDYAGATWFPTDCTNKCTFGRPDGNAAVNVIVIHDTEGGWDASVATLQYDGGKSVHYIIDADGARVGQFLHEVDTGWHAGNWCFNMHSIGIEHVGVASDPAGYSTGLYDASRALVTNIRTRWDVPLDRTHIIGHYQIPNGNMIAECSEPCTDTLTNCEESPSYGGAAHHTDPGYYWQWCQYMEHLGGSCTCNDAWSMWNCTTDHSEAVRCVGGVVEIAQCTGGCDVQPIGTPDICHTEPASGPDAAPIDPSAPDAAPVTPGQPDAGIDNPDDSGVSGGCGCEVGRHGRSNGLLVLLLFAGAAIVRRRCG